MEWEWNAVNNLKIGPKLNLKVPARTITSWF